MIIFHWERNTLYQREEPPSPVGLHRDISWRVRSTVDAPCVGDTYDSLDCVGEDAETLRRRIGLKRGCPRTLRNPAGKIKTKTRCLSEDADSRRRSGKKQNVASRLKDRRKNPTRYRGRCRSPSAAHLSQFRMLTILSSTKAQTSVLLPVKMVVSMACALKIRLEVSPI